MPRYHGDDTSEEMTMTPILRASPRGMHYFLRRRHGALADAEED